jgi:hypothetical protein
MQEVARFMDFQCGRVTEGRYRQAFAIAKLEKKGPGGAWTNLRRHTLEGEKRMRKIQLCLLVLTAVFATGCPKYRPKVDFNNKSNLVNKVNERFRDWQTEYYAALKAKDFARAKTARNELLEEALPYIDDAYIDFINDIQRGRDRGNFVADLVELGTSGAVGITKGERAIQILGVALTAFRGGRRSADLNFYKDTATPILISKMDGNRANVRATILTREKQEVSDYPVGSAIADIVDYYNAGTLVRAFTELAKDTAVQTQKSEEVLKLKKIDPSRVFNVAEADQDAAILIGTYRRKYQAILKGSDLNLQNEARAELLGIYSDIVANADFKPVLDELKKNPKYKQLMADLDSGDNAKIEAVTGVEIFEIVSQVLFTANKMNKRELIVPLKDIFVKHNS